MYKSAFLFFLTSFIVSGCAKNDAKTLANLNIVGGVKVSESENSQARKSTVALMKYSDIYFSICSGVLVAPRVVMTAAHCIQDNNKKMKYANISDYSVHFTTELDKNKSSKNKNKIKASKIIVHPDWTPANFTSNIWKTNDLAMIILSEDPPTTAVPVKFGYNYDISIKKGDILTLAGYGLTKNSKLIESSELRKVYAFVDNIFTFKELIKFELSSKSTCSGDSGGPAYYTKDNVTYLIGINSGNIIMENGDCVGGTLSSDLKYYKSWIEENIK